MLLTSLNTLQLTIRCFDVKVITDLFTFQTYAIELSYTQTLRIKLCANNTFVLILQLVYYIMHKILIHFYFLEFFLAMYTPRPSPTSKYLKLIQIIGQAEKRIMLAL